MPSRRVLTLVAVAVVFFAGAAAMPIVDTSRDIDYAVEVHPATDGTVDGLSYSESDVVPYDDLSPAAQRAFDRARAASNNTYVVDDENQTAPDLHYATDHIDVGHGLYPVRYEGDVYSLRADQIGGGIDVGALVQLYLLRPVLAGLGLVSGLFGAYYFVRE
ncbi:hypothetical protein [Haloferax larsenii]|uniref:hypothetical protein n=1 Tax=Haloferax larsenii TaxID=302484 RepID=UPI00215AB337|nr:hypothetical protein [Haloferax larsenii]